MVSREQLLDSMGRPITQGLFLELGYNSSAIYTLKDVDYEYKGKQYPSARRLYLELEDPTEYEFATQCFLGWDHWQRICANKMIFIHIQKWRDELEIKLRSRAVKMNIAAAEGGNYSAAKWIADRGWQTRGAGRPSKTEVEKETKIQSIIRSEYDDDIARLRVV
ncbi:hypothetical protein D3C87_1178360 [compost metagenome]